MGQQAHDQVGERDQVATTKLNFPPSKQKCGPCKQKPAARGNLKVVTKSYCVRHDGTQRLKGNPENWALQNK